ncbi:signal peptide peptidase SppA [Ferrovibrio sp.]|uniref:signal peptide peptidase SppA n=1 Tax=Ferrovibrio sp. TaxID=1917215 RepID=UPI000CC4CC86|nr:signal peptide peptidase SppA [Ferrovibrio sp.]PJI37633.1 MAG: signal peptide peptidase SppA [Ferrovibrio sp.]
MSSDTDAWLERRTLARRATRWRIVAVLALLVLALIGLWRLDPGNLIAQRQVHVARLEISGVIAENDWWLEKLKEAGEDDRVRAVILYINSPGGSTYGGEALFQAVRQLSEQKPVVSVIGTLGASAGYMVAIAGDYVLARETSLTGSIGVLFQTAEFSKLMEKVGVSAETITSGPLKAEPNPTRPMSPAGRAQIQNMVNETHAWFVDLVASRRDLPRDEVAKLADGRVYSGRAALQSRLIDGLGGVAEARDWLARTHRIPADLPLRDIPSEPPAGLLDGLGSRTFATLVGKSLIPERLRLDGLTSLWHPD